MMDRISIASSHKSPMTRFTCSGVGMDAMINSILSECSWGKVDRPADGTYTFQVIGFSSYAWVLSVG
jgi:hypothetical protein